MPLFRCTYLQPWEVDIEAPSLVAARERFMATVANKDTVLQSIEPRPPAPTVIPPPEIAA